MRRLDWKVSVLLAVLGAATACGAGEKGARSGDLPWVTQVDSTGDTIRVRITGEVPPEQVRRLVSEVEVGAEDGAEENTFGWVVSVLATPTRGFLVFDAQVPALRLFDSTGAFVKNIGHKGRGPGEFEQVNGITSLPDGRIVVWDATGARLNTYSDTGAFLTSWRVPFSGHFGQNMLWSDDAGRVYAWAVLERDSVDFTRGTRGVIVFGDDGKVLDSLPYPVWREPPPSLIAKTSDGRGASSYTFPFWPSSVASVSPQGGFVSGPGDPYVLYFTHRDGVKPVRIDRDFTPVPVSPTERSEHKALVESGLRRTDPNWSWTVAGIPDNKPAYDEVTVALDGRVWVEVSTPGVAIPAAELPPIRPGQESQPRLTTRTPTMYDVFSPQGRLLGRVEFPRRVAIRTARGNDVYAVKRDSLDVQYVVRYRVEPALPR
ncbi:MAG: 6-bladed beta-propeller [Gemmatimonadetes bacterium]|nr:6-bladed beta-propeller [Gemmatimonadota bacterium]